MALKKMFRGLRGSKEVKQVVQKRHGPCLPTIQEDEPEVMTMNSINLSIARLSSTAARRAARSAKHAARTAHIQKEPVFFSIPTKKLAQQIQQEQRKKESFWASAFNGGFAGPAI
mmetsp:Transcript_10586/g.20833  ORF Transcript_10586/g.20833 Transcript_10586/m.20833 type:complete len:115 (-) Transcript_10586:442-786(-)|eukprot:CAMPEP_0171496258 /NCGR_PEP_ID=MMETSP0958-20121227/6600_1 /TAXON_ID=87120 /ORGANISM="Aurantiochytrium limacinum, Strain ATCCMYA-1381" /LENGTH=114 /DNA_ID=CAMNT_0012030337 /DNA_START=192 /DNA_END=536 /DNA_ORIENTATION=-